MKFWKQLTCTALAALGLAGAAQAQPKVVISQVYGGAGCGTAGCSTYKQDYVEIFNAGNASQNLTGWSVQYAGSGGTFSSGNVVNLSGSIAPGEFRLISYGAVSANGVTALPTVDFPGPAGVSMSNASGTVAVVNTTTAIPGTAGTVCADASIVDLVAYGSRSCAEGTAAPSPTNTNSALFRANGGCTDTGNNNSDFSNAAPNPRNSGTPAAPCSGTSGPVGSNTTTTSSSCPNVSVTFSVTVTPGTNPTITSVIADFTSIGGSAGVAMSNGGSGLVYTSVQTIATATTPGAKSIPVVITDGAALTGNATISYTVNNCTLGITSSSFSPAGVCSGESVTFSVTVRKNTITGQGPSTGVVVALDLTNVNNFAPLSQNMTFVGVDPNNADRLIYSLTHTVPAGQLSGTGSVGVTVTDAQNNLFNGTGATPFPFNVLLAGPCTPATSEIVISQVYGGGGATTGTPTFKEDYVELFNRGTTPVNVTGWTLQYASATGPSTPPWAVSSTLSATINPGQYYLVRLTTATMGTTGADLPIAPDFIPASGLSLSATSGKIALVSDAVALVATNPSDATIKDLVGYGGANGFEGVAPASGLENTLAAFRLQNGCRDTNQNAADFVAATPAPRNSASPANSCVATACCQNDGTCVVTAPGGTCSGTLQIGQSTCPPTPACPQPAVCCRAAACTVELPASCTSGANPGTVGTGTTCSPTNPCVTVTNVFCCRGATCFEVPVADCVNPPVGNAITVTSCGAGNALATCCYADFNHDGNPSIDDLFLYFNAYFTGSPWANWGGNGIAPPVIDDLFLFINGYFVGCS